jgi:cyclophilin family peptidyl-prolyl cis-trans isomerase
MSVNICAVMLLATVLGQSQQSFSHENGPTMPESSGGERDIAVIETSMGVIEIELFSSQTPKTVKNFVGLAEKGAYNGVIFHRVIDGFMIQGGDPTGTGSGGQSIYGKPFEDEIVSSLKHTAPGFLSMANRGPNTNTSQFFITLAATPWLDGKHTIFGKVVGGMDVVQAIGKVKTTKPGDRPVVDVVMKKVTIRKESTAKEKK